MCRKQRSTASSSIDFALASLLPAAFLQCSSSPTNEGNDDSRGLMVRLQDTGKLVGAKAAVLPGPTSHSRRQDLSS